MKLQTEPVARRELDKSQLDAAFVEAHRRTWAILADLTPVQMQVPCDPGINPPLWEYAHISWFTEHWNPQRNSTGRFAPTWSLLLADADRWYRLLSDARRNPGVEEDDQPIGAIRFSMTGHCAALRDPDAIPLRRRASGRTRVRGDGDVRFGARSAWERPTDHAGAARLRSASPHRLRPTRASS